VAVEANKGEERAGRLRRRAWRWLAQAVGYSLVAAGFAGFALISLAQLGQRAGRLASLELPVGELCGAVYDRHTSLLWLASCTYGRIQGYTPEGRFRVGWFVPASGGSFRMWRAAPGVLRVSLARPRTLVAYDRWGRRVTTEEMIRRRREVETTPTEIGEGRVAGSRPEAVSVERFLGRWSVVVETGDGAAFSVRSSLWPGRSSRCPAFSWCSPAWR
jgi:hypothetical protein